MFNATFDLPPRMNKPPLILAPAKLPVFLINWLLHQHAARAGGSMIQAFPLRITGRNWPRETDT